MIDRSCKCRYVGREIEYRETNPDCFQHGIDWDYARVRDEPIADRMAFLRYRVYLSTVADEIEWWLKTYMSESRKDLQR